MQTRRGFDPVIHEAGGREGRSKASMPTPRPVSMGLLYTPKVDFEEAWKAESRRRLLSETAPYPYHPPELLRLTE